MIFTPGCTAEVFGEISRQFEAFSGVDNILFLALVETCDRKPFKVQKSKHNAFLLKLL